MAANNSKAMEYIYGFGVHFYADDINSPSLLNQAKKQFPTKVIINTESCEGSNMGESHFPLLGSWRRAESYILSFIQVFFKIIQFKY